MAARKYFLQVKTKCCKQCVFRAAETEVWNFDEGKSEIIGPKLTGFAYSAGLYAVDSEFCKK